MNISEFIQNYNLHDSLIEKVDYDEKNKIVTIIIDFCYWQQVGYTDDMPETGIIVVDFKNVSKFIFTSYQINSDEIIDVTYDETNGLSLILMNDILKDCVEINIYAETVNIRKL